MVEHKRDDEILEIAREVIYGLDLFQRNGRFSMKKLINYMKGRVENKLHCAKKENGESTSCH